MILALRFQSDLPAEATTRPGATHPRSCTRSGLTGAKIRVLWRSHARMVTSAPVRKVVVDAGGFSRFRRAAETPLNIVLEARP